MTKQRVTIELQTSSDGEATHWYLFGGTGKPITDSTRYGDKLPFATPDGALTAAAKAANKLLWVERQCA